MSKSLFESKEYAVLLAIFYTFLWGLAFPLVKICMEGFGAYDNASKCLVAGIRFMLSGLGLLLLCAFREKDGIKIQRNQVKFVVAYGALGVFAQYGLTYIALSYMDGSKGAVFDQLCVFIVIFFSGIFFKGDKLNITKFIGCIVGFLGILVINTDSFVFSFSFEAEGAMILAAICQAIVYFLSKASCGRISGCKMIGWGQLLGGIMLTVFALLFGAGIEKVTPIGVIALLALSLISAVAYVLSLIPLKYHPASEMSVFNLLITVFGVVMSALILGENIFRWNYLVSVAVICVGIIMVNRKGKSKGDI
jgi:drug/metabolite transporter (DMT)-like permease